MAILDSAWDAGRKNERRQTFRFDQITGRFQLGIASLRTANATGAIAVGAGFQVFEKVAGAQTYIKVVVLIFLFGVLAFTFSYVCLFIARMEFDRYLAQKTKERAEWEEIFRPSKGPPTTLSAVRTRWVMALLSSLVSVTCFLVGLGAVMQFVTQQLPH
ncbi:MAG: hypothetical protein WBD11_07420 [Xanthobacteraceae bacterium]